VKKIVALIKPNAPLVYFANQVHRRHPLQRLIVEDKTMGQAPFFCRLKTRLALGARAANSRRLAVQVKNREMANLYSRLLGSDWLDLDESIPVTFCRSINDPEVQTLLEQEKPDLLLDHGTSIVRDHIIATAPMALNLHWGLSPYYRGTHCTEWALINWDPRNIGVTVHRLAKSIDGGDVLGQKRIAAAPDDTVDALNLKLTVAGTQIVVDALDDWQRGCEWPFHTQDHALGYLTLNRQWSRLLRSQLDRLQSTGGIQQMLKTPARASEVPIITYARQSPGPERRNATS
jgi:folate-dependent phosphoribosylglycinamide formyltransferase PurN